MPEFIISSKTRNRGIEEEKVILQAVGAAKRGDYSLGEMIANMVLQKFKECKNDPNQFNAIYSYAKTRHMLHRYNHMLALPRAEKDWEEEGKRFLGLTTVNPVTLWSQYFAIADQDARFAWAGRLSGAESRMMYDFMQIVLLHPGDSHEEYEKKMADLATGKLLSAMQSNWNRNNQEMPSARPSQEPEYKDHEAKSVTSPGRGCMLVVMLVAIFMCIAK